MHISSGHLQNLLPLKLQISYSSHGLYLWESYYYKYAKYLIQCYKDKRLVLSTTAADLRMWIFCHEYGPSSPRHVYKSLPCPELKFCLPLKNQQLLHFLLLCCHCRSIILCDYAVPCIGDNVCRVNMSYRLSSLAGVGSRQAAARPATWVSVAGFTSVSWAGGRLCVCVCMCMSTYVWRSELHYHCFETSWKDYCMWFLKNTAVLQCTIFSYSVPWLSLPLNLHILNFIIICLDPPTFNIKY